jgi:hypothetical protein
MFLKNKMIVVHGYIGVKRNSKTLPFFKILNRFLANWALKFDSANIPKTFV